MGVYLPEFSAVCSKGVQSRTKAVLTPLGRSDGKNVA